MASPMLKVTRKVLSYALITLFSADLRIRSATTRAPSSVRIRQDHTKFFPAETPHNIDLTHIFLDDIGDLL